MVCRPILALSAGSWARSWLALALLLVVTGSARAESQSASYRLESSTLDASGEALSSTSYRETDSLGQELCIGTSSSPHLILQSGFWSFAGSGLVPVVLHVRKNPSDREDLDLDWSGNNPPYTIYRSANCAGVFADFLTTEPARVYTDASPLADRLSCYNVLATAPGPLADGGGPLAAERTSPTTGATPP